MFRSLWLTAEENYCTVNQRSMEERNAWETAANAAKRDTIANNIGTTMTKTRRVPNTIMVICQLIL